MTAHWTDAEMDRREAMAHEVHNAYHGTTDGTVNQFDRALVAWHLTKVGALEAELADLKDDYRDLVKENEALLDK